MNLPDIMRLDSKEVSDAIIEVMHRLATTENEENLESNRHVGIQFGLSEHFMGSVKAATDQYLNMRNDRTELQAEMMRTMMLAFLAGWLAHARLEQPKWAENLNGKVN